MIYAIRAIGTDHIKFGYTGHKSAKSRLETLQTGCPFELVIEAECPGGFALEAWVHTRLRKAGLERHNEWFIYSKGAIEIVEFMKAGRLSELERSSITPTHRRLGKALDFAREQMKARDQRAGE